MSAITYRSDMTVELVQHCGDDLGIARAAWVSTGRKEEPDRVAALLRFLAANRHGTPFEHASITARVEAPIFVWREWHRHRVGWSYNEESARYKTLEPVFYLPARDRPMMKVADWKAGRPKFLPCDSLELYEEIVGDMKAGYESEYPRYLRQLARGIDPGLARDNLPVGIYSSCFVTCNPRSLMHFLTLRTAENALWEIRLAALQLEQIFASLFPLTHAAYVMGGRAAP